MTRRRGGVWTPCVRARRVDAVGGVDAVCACAPCGRRWAARLKNHPRKGNQIKTSRKGGFFILCQQLFAK